MSKLLTAGYCLVAGAALGIFFFGGLWWTVRQGLTSAHPGLWFAASLLVRTAIVLAALYGVAQDRWSRWVFCLVGFFVARMFMMPRAGPGGRPNLKCWKEVNHVP